MFKNWENLDHKNGIADLFSQILFMRRSFHLKGNPWTTTTQIIWILEGYTEPWLDGF